MNSIGIRSCFVTGAGGVVGRAVCRQLAEQGARVVAHDLPGRLEDGPAGAVEPVCGDVLDWPHLSAAVRGAGCEYVVHLAALVASYANAHPREAVHVNVAGVANVCEAAHASGCRGIVYVSSRSVYGNVGRAYAHPHYRRVTERHPCRPESFYPTTKRAAEMVIERYASNYGLPAVILRIGAIYGPGKSASHGVTRAFSELIEAGVRGEPYVIGGASQLEDFVYSEDIPHAIAAGLRRLQEGKVREAEIYNIGSGTGVSVRDFAAMVAKTTGTPNTVLPGIGVGGRDTRQSFIMSDWRARRVLGYRPRFGLQSGISHYVDALRRGQHDQP